LQHAALHSHQRTVSKFVEAGSVENQIFFDVFTLPHIGTDFRDLNI